jgi:ribosomal protein S18 acetylase RimI-like enzyme
MLTRAAAVDRTGSVDALEDMDSQFSDPWCNPETDFLLALAQDGQVAAMGRIFVNPAPRRERYANLMVEVNPEYRSSNLDEPIFTWMEAHARQRLLELPADLPRSLRTLSLDYLTDRIRLFERHGFQITRSWYRMRRDLSQPIPDEHLPAGLTLCTYHPELEKNLLEAFNESFSDHWGFEPVSYEDWLALFIRATVFRPELSFLAMEGAGSQAQIAGFSVNFIRAEDNRREGLAEGFITELGTRRPWRKRGIASALLCESMRAFKSAGLDYAALGVDTQSQTGAVHLYERLGFTVIKRSFTFAKPVD